MRNSLLVLLLVLCVGGGVVLGWRIDSAGAGRPVPVSKEASIGGACC